MSKQFVGLSCNVWCKWEGLPPTYRVYLDDELFTERTYRLNDDVYLLENLEIYAEPGEYQLRYELVPPNLAKLQVSIPIIRHGAATINSQGILRITDETA
jgi:hypothetical protein